MKRFLPGLIAVLVIAAVAIHLFHKPAEKGEQLASDASEALGQRAAIEVANLLGNKGQIALIGLEANSREAPTYILAVDTFTSTLKKHGIGIARSKNIPNGLNTLMINHSLAANDYIEFADQSPKADAIVTFAGSPGMSSDELQKFQASHPPLIVVDLFGVLKDAGIPELVEQKIIALALVPRNAAEVEAVKDEPKIFERYYKIFRPTPAKP